jgi:dienelactone hydrolase
LKEDPMKSACAVVLCLLVAGSAVADIHTETVDYTAAGTALKGFLAYDDASTAERPGVLVVHEWWGLNDYARARAEKLAASGFVAFALDMYGGGKNTAHPKEADLWSKAVQEQQEVAKARFQAAYDLLAANSRVAPGKIAAIGYCFGGAVVLTMAAAGADLDGVVSYHGALPTEPVAAGTTVKAKILAYQGAADPFVTAEQTATFQHNLEAAGAEWEFVLFGGAKHSFTNPGVDQFGVPGLAYDAEADRRSWQGTMGFFDEIFGD